MLQVPDIQEVFDNLQGQLSDTWASTDSFYGILMLVFGLLIVIWCIRKAARTVSWLVGFFLFLQIMHVIAFKTDIGVMFPVLQGIFKFEPLVALAQLLRNTPVCGWLLWLQAFLDATVSGAFQTIWHWILIAFDWCKTYIHT